MVDEVSEDHVEDGVGDLLTEVIGETFLFWSWFEKRLDEKDSVDDYSKDAGQDHDGVLYLQGFDLAQGHWLDMLDSFQINPQWYYKEDIHDDGINHQYPKINLRKTRNVLVFHKNTDQCNTDELYNYPDHIVNIQIIDINLLPFGEMRDLDGSHKTLIVIPANGQKNGLYDKSRKYIEPYVTLGEG